MDEIITFTFKFKVDDRPYDFNEISDSRNNALSILRGDLYKVLATIETALNVV